MRIKYYVLSIKYLGIIFLISIFTLYPGPFTLTPILAQEMNSQNFKISGGNFNMTSGNKSSATYKLSDVVGQTAAGVFFSKGYIINSGFLNSAAGQILSFSVTPSVVDFGELIPDTPIEKTIILSISNGNVPGYTVKASENQPLSTSVGATILDTACSLGSPCTINTANLWLDNHTYGVGYRMSGSASPKDFSKTDFFRPFASTLRNDLPAIVMESKARKAVDRSTMTIRVNTNRSQPVGQYRNIISFIAMAGI